MAWTLGKIVILCVVPVIYGVDYDDALLRKDLLSKYKYGRPAANPNEPVDVRVGFNLFQIKELDGKKQILSSFGQLLMLWYDTSLRWNRAAYNGLRQTTLSAEDIWIPVLGVRNSASNAIDSNWASSFPLLVSSDGEVIYAPSGSFDTSCDLNMRKFPFDTQHCNIDVGNFLYTNKSVNLQPLPPASVNMEFFTPNKEFTVSGNETKLELVTGTISFFPPHDNTIPLIRISIPLKRKYFYYVMYIMLPTIVFSVLSVVIFAIPVDSGEKLGVGITILLSFSVFMLILADKTPQTSENLPVLAIYLTSVICITAMALVCSILVIRIHHTVPPHPLPGWVRSGILNGLGGLFCMVDRNKVSDAPKQDLANSDGNDDISELKNTNLIQTTPDDQTVLAEIQKMTRKMEEDAEAEQLQEQWKMVARIIDKFFLVFFLIANLSLAVGLLLIVPFV